MNIALWLIAGVLTVAYVTGGVVQIAVPQERYRALGPSQHWVDDFNASQLKMIGTIKLVLALGLVVPGVVGVFTVVTPLAACGLMVFMAGATTTRFRRNEWRYLPGDLAFLGLFAFLAWGRFALHPL